ncbi:MAG: hypothetical protein LBQ46_03865 [Treponema sp.]|nr:hypothetical protein [Treponema sp.]
MKFKFLFLSFNLVILIFLLILFLMPPLILGEFFSSPWSGSFIRSFWPLAAILAAALILLDVYYFSNRGLFRLLEREDWPALAGFLETRIQRRGRYPGHLVRLYVNTCLILSDSPSVVSLENKLALAKPALVERNALIFGAARILAKDYAGALRFFAARDASPGGGSRGAAGPRGLSLPFFGRGPSKQWLAWYHGFSLLLDKRFQEAADKFRLLAGESGDPLVAGLAAWFLADNLSQLIEGSQDAALIARERVRSSIKTRRDWEGESARVETEIHAAILRKYISDAGDWIYGSSAHAGGTGDENL